MRSPLAGPLGPWKPLGRIAAIAWIAAYALFLLYAFANRPNFLFVDFVNLMIHEAGHPFFSWFHSYQLMILGGTLAELMVPALCAAYFFAHRETQGFAFSAFWFFENFLYIGTYMADARAEALPLVGSGDHDWNILFGAWGLLLQDVHIGETTRLAGWAGMLAVVLWLAWQTLRAAPRGARFDAHGAG